MGAHSATFLSAPDGPSNGEMTRKVFQNDYYNHPPQARRALPQCNIVDDHGDELQSSCSPISPKPQVIGAEGHEGIHENFGAVQGSKPAHSDQEKPVYMPIFDVETRS